MALVQIESTAFLIRKKRLNPETFPIKITGFLRRFHVADQIDRFFAVLSPPTDRKHRAISLLREERTGDADALAALGGIPQGLKMKWLALIIQCDAPGRAADVLPCPSIDYGLEVGPIKLPVSKKNNSGSVWNKGLNLLYQSNVKTLGKVPLLALAHYPSNGQSPPLVNQCHHERNTPSSHSASIHHQHQGQVGQAEEKRISKRKKVGIGADARILQPATKMFLTAFGFGCVRKFTCNLWKLAALAANDATDESRKGVEVPGKIAGCAGKCLPDGVLDGGESFLLSLMSGSISCSFGNLA